MGWDPLLHHQPIHSDLESKATNLLGLLREVKACKNALRRGLLKIKQRYPIER